MDNFTRRITIITIALVVVVIFASAVYANLSPGAKAPNFTLPTIDGKSFTLQDSFKNTPSVVVLDIWATWCPPCRGEIPHLINLQKELKGKHVTIVGVAIDDEKSAVQSFVKEQGVNYTIALDPRGNKLGKSYGIGGIPATYIIDKKGVVRYVHSGFPRDPQEQKHEAAAIKSEINKLMAGK